MFEVVGKVEELTLIFRKNGNVILRQWGNYGKDNRVELTREQRATAAEMLSDVRAGKFANAAINLGPTEGVNTSDALLHLDVHGHVLVAQMDCVGAINAITDAIDLMADWASADPPPIWDVVERYR